MASLPTAFDSQPMGIATLPAPPTPLLGRETELRRLHTLLDKGDTRLITLTGPGGVGKTRLAVAAAAYVDDRSDESGQHRTMFIPLAAIADPDQVLPAIARAMDVRDTPGLPGNAAQRLAARLGGAPTLIVLDNMEQVVAAASDLAGLLSACPGLTLIVTSRLPLHIRGEREFPVEPLQLPMPATQSLDSISQSHAVRLFVETAQRVRPGFALTEANAATVAEICQRLDGLPLAIELAAARMKVLSVSALLARLANRLSVLTGGPRDLPDRQQTLRDTIAWSYQLLTPEEQAHFARMSVFVGGASLGAAEAVAAGEPGDVLAILTSLIDHSLVRQDAQDDEPRLVMLETIREFARERLAGSGEDQATRDRHAAWCLSLASAAGLRLYGPEQHAWLERLDLEGDNLRAALEWLSARGDPDDALQLATVLWRYWEIRGQLREAQARLEAALARASAEPSPARAKALNNLGNVYLDMGEPGEAVTRYEASLAMRGALDDPEGMADTLNNLGLVALGQADTATARTRHEESLAIRRELRDPWGIALSLSNLGDVANVDRDFDTAERLHQEALDIRRRQGEPRAIGYSLNNLGESALGKGDLPRAGDLFRAAQEYLHRVGDRSGEALVLHNLGLTALRRRDYGDSVVALASAFRLRVEIQERQGIIDTLALLPQLAESAGESNLAATFKAIIRAAEGPPEPRQANPDELIDQLSRALTIDRPAASPPPLAVVPDPMKDLTPREREVIRLVAEGRSDREIGEELFITTRTASTHVTNILGKLALPSRTAAAAWVLRHDAR